MARAWNSTGSPFHAGEQDVQERLGVRDIEAWARKMVRDYLPVEHRAFHTALPFLVIAARVPWTTPASTTIAKAGSTALCWPSGRRPDDHPSLTELGL